MVSAKESVETCIVTLADFDKCRDYSFMMWQWRNYQFLDLQLHRNRTPVYIP